MIEREEVIGRLQGGNRGLQISSESRRGHVESMQELLCSFERSNGPSRPHRRTIRIPLRNAAVFLVAFGIGVAAAAYSDGVPGDPFYRAKRVAEQPARIVDRDLVASNRLGELQELIDRGADPDSVLTARTDAAKALLNGQSHDKAQALSLLAWPGGLAGRGVDVDATDEGLLITGAEWFNERGYTASLADGHLVTISVLAGEILIATTGDWTVLTIGTGWLLTNDDVDQVYLIQRQGQDLRVNSSGAGRSSSSEEALGPVGTPTLSADRSRFGNPPATPTDEPSSVSSSEPVSTAAGSATDDTTFTSRSATVPSTVAPGGGSAGPTTAITAPPATAGSTSSPSRSLPQTTAAPGTSPSTTGAPTTTVAPTTTIATPTTPAPTTTTIPPTEAWSFYLENPSSGNTSSSRNLPLSAGSAPSGKLRNFDTDRDDEPGLLIERDGDGLSGSDSTKIQVWTWTSSGSTAFNGDAKLTIWLAAEDFEDDERIGLQASIELCDQGCTRLGTAQWNGSASEDRFRSATISLGSVNASVPAGATLRLKVVVPDGLASTDVMFAYDSASHPSRLSIG